MTFSPFRGERKHQTLIRPYPHSTEESCRQTDKIDRLNTYPETTHIYI